MNKLVFFFILFFLSLFGSAQLDRDVRLINGYKHLGKNFRKVKLSLEFDARNTFINSNRSKLGGLKTGVYINRIHYYGIGLYGTTVPLTISKLPGSDQEIHTANAEFSYFSTFYERVLYFSPRWEWSAAAHLGAGQIRVAYQHSPESETVFLKPIETRPFELSSSVYFHLNYWISFGGGYGYRVMRKTPKDLQPIFNGSIYLVKVKLRLIKRIRAIYNKDVKNEY